MTKQSIILHTWEILHWRNRGAYFAFAGFHLPHTASLRPPLCPCKALAEAIYNLAKRSLCNGILKEVHYYGLPQKFFKFSRNDGMADASQWWGGKAQWRVVEWRNVCDSYCCFGRISSIQFVSSGLNVLSVRKRKKSPSLITSKNRAGALWLRTVFKVSSCLLA